MGRMISLPFCGRVWKGVLGALALLIVLASLPGTAFAASDSTQLSPGEAGRLAANASQRDIVIFKNQHSEVPASPTYAARRDTVEHAERQGVLNELQQVRAKDVHEFRVLNALSTTISPGEAQRLRNNPQVQAVVPDVAHRVPWHELAATASEPGASSTDHADQALCPSDPKQPLLEPEALQVMNVEFQPGDKKPAAHDLADGSGVKIGAIADGLDINNPDFQRNGKSVVEDYQDFSGYGNDATTGGDEAFLDAGAIAAQGNTTYDLSKFVSPTHPLPDNCNIRIKGVAPGASLAMLNVVGSAPNFFNSQIVQAIDHAVLVDKVNVLNESFGSEPTSSTNNDPVILANQNAVAAGVTVVASSGDSGPTNTIGAPASDPGIITVGGTTTFRSYRQVTYAGTQLQPGGWLNNNIAALSSAGTTQFGPRTVDVVAPGDSVWEPCSADVKHYTSCTGFTNGSSAIQLIGGTSLSAPLTAGTAALVIQTYAKAHGGTYPSPALVKQIIVSSATDLRAPADHQGAGLVNALKAVHLAQGSGLLIDQTSLVSVKPVGSAPSYKLGVTNQGDKSQTIKPALSTLDPTPTWNDDGSVTLNDKSPTFSSRTGKAISYQIHHFNVPAGVDYLNGNIAWDGIKQKNSAVYEMLFDPSGKLAGFSFWGDKGTGFGHVEVRKPAAGSWTAEIFSTENDKTPKYTGEVKFSYFGQRFQSIGAVNPGELRLAPGEHGSITVSLPASAQPGDTAASLLLSTGSDDNGSIPVLLRSLIPSGGKFSGTLTGGSTQGGQQLSYQFDVPSGQPSLNLGLTLHDPNYNLIGVLIDPHGETLDIQSTQTGSNPDTFGQKMQFFRLQPEGGRWTLGLALAPPIDGSRLSEAFTGQVDTAAPKLVVEGVPNSAATVLARGKAVKATIKVSNSGLVKKDFLADARLGQRSEMTLAGSNAKGVALPLSVTTQPSFIIPPGTDEAIFSATGSVPIVLEASTGVGDPDHFGAAQPNNTAVITVSDPELAPGTWGAAPEAKGPFPGSGVGKATVDVSATADTYPFDSAVSASSGDVWMQAVNSSAPSTPVSVDPGGSGMITLTITPNAEKGTVVRGFIAIDTYNSYTGSGDEVGMIPYTYKVG